MKDGMAGKSGERSRSLSRKETRFLKIKIFLKDGKFSRKVCCYACIHTKNTHSFLTKREILEIVYTGALSS